MFVNEEYKSYKYIVEESDNYIVLSKTKSVEGDWQNPDEISVIYQYIKPSTLVIEDVRSFTSSRNFEEIEVSTDFWDRGDVPEIFSCGLILIFFLIFILNGLTKIGKKGGIFFGQ